MKGVEHSILNEKDSDMANKRQKSKRKPAAKIIQPIDLPEWLIVHNVPKAESRKHNSQAKRRQDQVPAEGRKRQRSTP